MIGYWTADQIQSEQHDIDALTKEHKAMQKDRKSDDDWQGYLRGDFLEQRGYKWQAK